MSTYIILLRGINVGGHKKIKMADLRQLLSAAAFEDVRSYVQSGNIVLSSEASASAVQDKIAQIIDEHYGFKVPVFVLLVEDLLAAIQQQPFIDKEEKRLHLTFLEQAPSPEIVKNSLPPKFDTPDEYQIIDKTVFLYCPNGYGRSKLTNDFWERKLQLNATTRNWKTANKLAEIAHN